MDDVPLLDRRKALSDLDDDVEIYNEVVTTFHEDTPRQLVAMRQATLAEDLTTLCRLAHSLKSSARTVGGMRLGNIAEDMESRCETLPPEQRMQLITSMEREYSLLKEALDALDSSVH